MLNKKISNSIVLIRVCLTEKHIKFLYKLLKERKIQDSISHKKLPSIEKHKIFVKSKPYRYWYIIEVDGLFFGSAYITKTNSIAIHLMKSNILLYEKILGYIIENIQPLKPLPSIRGRNFIVNLSVNSTTYSKCIKKIGGVKIQETFGFISEKYSRR